MRRPWLAAALLSLAALPAAAEIGVGRRADCLMVVNGSRLIDGPCLFTPLDSDGSFTIAGLNGRYFAYVLMDRPGVATGHWNGAPYAGHAHDPLGRLYREDACWVNASASVCAW